jgi:hypothetical protein
MNKKTYQAKAAKKGLDVEKTVAFRFTNYRLDKDVQEWLFQMGFDQGTVTDCNSHTMPLRNIKSDIVVNVNSKPLYISLKSYKIKAPFNQLERGEVDRYTTQWKLSSTVSEGLKYFCGRFKPYQGINLRDKKKRRMYMDELDITFRNSILEFFTAQKYQVISELIRGRNQLYPPDFFMVYDYNNNFARIVPIEDTIRVFALGEVLVTKRGNIQISNSITLQRKGGDKGKDSANQLQFKMNPSIVMTGGI